MDWEWRIVTDDQKELIKATAEGAAKGALGDLLLGLSGPLQEIAGMVQERFRERRLERRVKLIQRFQAFVVNAGFEPHQIQDNIFVPILTASDLQDEESMQEKFAALLANAADPRDLVAVHPAFPRILSELTPRDAKFLDALYADAAAQSKGPPKYPPLGGIHYDKNRLFLIYGTAGLSKYRLGMISHGDLADNGPEIYAEWAAFDVMFENLKRHQLLSERVDTKVRDHGPPSPGVQVHATVFYILSEFGASFIRACQPPHHQEQ